MVQLDKKTIDAIKKISDAIEGTGFYMNRFVIGDNYNKATVIEFDIREINDVDQKGDEQ